MVAFGDKSCRALALELGVTCDISVTRKAVWRFLQKPAMVRFLEALLSYALKESLKRKRQGLLSIIGDGVPNLPGVKSILVGDATTICLHPSLYKDYPGSHNHLDVDKSHLKIQLTADLLTGEFVDVSLDPYQRSDGTAAHDILSKLEAGDLLIRDLGYSSIEVFQRIDEQEAFFVSRLKSSINVYDSSGEQMDLLRFLQTQATRPEDTVRKSVKIGKSAQLPCELIAIRVPEEIGNKRRADLRQDHKDKGFSAPSKERLARLDWTILVTNLPEETADNEQVRELYLMRWRIENIFKSCKSHTGLMELIQHKTNAMHMKSLILAWLLLMMILAKGGAFSMTQLRELYSTSGEPECYELVVHNESLFKTLTKRVLTLGFYIELAGCDMKIDKHIERTSRYSAMHNQTELTDGRTALSEIIASVLEVENSGSLCQH